MKLMTAALFLVEVRRTLAPHNTASTTRLGLRGETGEVCDLIKKWTGHRAPREADKLIKELGDCAWYGASKLIECEIEESTRAAMIESLTGGLPGGMYTHGMSDGELIQWAEDLNDVGVTLAKGKFPFEIQDPAVEFFGIIARLAAAVGVSFEEVLSRNVAKLRARYPEGFSTEASLAKADERPPVIELGVGPTDANGSPVDPVAEFFTRELASGNGAGMP